MTAAFSIPVAIKSDIEEACRRTRAFVRDIGFSVADAEAVVLSVSELASNLVRYARAGSISVSDAGMGPDVRVVVESNDSGPGIANVTQALTDGFSTGGGMGSGLSGVRRLMDEFDITSDLDGTHIRAIKWRRSR